MSNSPFHAGERAVQKRAGAAAMALRVGNGIHDRIPHAARDFLRAQPIVFVGMEDGDGRVWASPIVGQPGFLERLSDQSVRVNAAPGWLDPLYTTLTREARDIGPGIGMLAIDLAARKRMRLNGIVADQTDGTFLVHARQVYANCPKYIQARVLDERFAPSSNGACTKVGQKLTAAQRDRIARADTFFIGSTDGHGGADVSHRGGNPGFIDVLGNRTLAFPDYAGNMMFNSLGNLTADGRAGLLFVDFDTGDTLQVSGKAEVIWQGDRVSQPRGAHRIVEFHVAAVVEITNNVPLHWRLVEYSPFNP